jgi:hypothetical protein
VDDCCNSSDEDIIIRKSSIQSNLSNSDKDTDDEHDDQFSTVDNETNDEVLNNDTSWNNMKTLRGNVYTRYIAFKKILILYIYYYYYAEPDTFLQEMYKLFKVMHTDIRRLCDENQKLNKEICDIKAIISNNSNLGGSKNKRKVLDYDSSWLMVCN